MRSNEKLQKLFALFIPSSSQLHRLARFVAHSFQTNNPCKILMVIEE